MNLDHLRYFEVLAQLEHYGKAAEKLHISQPNLTYAVSQIEQELGAPLFEKAGRSIRLTRYGHEFLRVVKSSLDVLDSGTRAVREASQNGGLILLGSIRTLGTTLVPDLMRNFQAQTDFDVRFQLRSENGFSASLLKAVEEKRLDFCFTSSPGNAAVFESFSFHRKPFGAPTEQQAERGIAGHPAISADLFCILLRSAQKCGCAFQPDPCSTNGCYGNGGGRCHCRAGGIRLWNRRATG